VDKVRSNDNSTAPLGKIELRLHLVQQVFNSLDPSPFPEKDLDDKAVEFIVGWAEEFASDAPLVLIVHLPEEERQSAAEASIPGAIKEYFSYRSAGEERRLRQLLRLGRRSALIGLAFLAMCNLASEGLAALSDNPISVLGQQGLVIFGWVANWRPAEIFLYEWWPIRRRAKLYDRLARMPVEIRFFDRMSPA
jgi:hypothetical protein